MSCRRSQNEWKRIFASGPIQHSEPEKIQRALDMMQVPNLGAHVIKTPAGEARSLMFSDPKVEKVSKNLGLEEQGAGSYNLPQNMKQNWVINFLTAVLRHQVVIMISLQWEHLGFLLNITSSPMKLQSRFG